jgi:putative PIN family toxin of toxin-antitoxin system
VRVLLDSNVVVAAFAARGLCEAVFELCIDSHEVIASEKLLSEVEKNLRKRIKLPEVKVRAIIRLLRENCILLTPGSVDSTACRDPKDLHILGLVEAGKTECIVTGDQDLLILGKFHRCKILTPRQFSDLARRK